MLLLFSDWIKCFQRDQFIDKNGILVPEKQLSLQSKYSFTALIVIKYAKISTRIFSVNLLTTREKILQLYWALRNLSKKMFCDLMSKTVAQAVQQFWRNHFVSLENNNMRRWFCLSILIAVGKIVAIFDFALECLVRKLKKPNGKNFLDFHFERKTHKMKTYRSFHFSFNSIIESHVFHFWFLIFNFYENEMDERSTHQS